MLGAVGVPKRGLQWPLTVHPANLAMQWLLSLGVSADNILAVSTSTYILAFESASSCALPAVCRAADRLLALPASIYTGPITEILLVGASGAAGAVGAVRAHDAAPVVPSDISPPFSSDIAPALAVSAAFVQPAGTGEWGAALTSMAAGVVLNQPV